MIFKFKHEGGIDCSYNDETSTLSIGKSVCVSGVSKDSLEEAVSNLLILSNTYGCVSGDYEAIMAVFMSKNREDNFAINLMDEVEKTKWEQDNTHVCPICGKTFIGYGNNPYPIVTDGLCCDECNEYVIRMRAMFHSCSDLIDDCVNCLKKGTPACSGSFYTCLVGETVYFMIYKNKGLRVMVDCDEPTMQEIVQKSLQTYLDNNHCNKNLKGIGSWGETTIRYCLKEWRQKCEEECKELEYVE